MDGLFVGWFDDWLVGWLVGRMIGWSVGLSDGQLVDPGQKSLLCERIARERGIHDWH